MAADPEEGGEIEGRPKTRFGSDYSEKVNFTKLARGKERKASSERKKRCPGLEKG